MPQPKAPQSVETVEAWTTYARTRLNEGKLRSEDIDLLSSVYRKCVRAYRQRLLYLHTSSPSIYASTVAGAEHSPEVGSITEIDPMAPDFQYASVHEAIADGWRVIHFPYQQAAYDDREIDVIGYEFILEKLEA